MNANSIWTAALVAGFCVSALPASAVTLGAVDGTADNGASLAAALDVSASNGVSILGGTSNFIGTSTQSADFSPTGDPIFGNRSGIVLTNGAGAGPNDPIGVATLTGSSTTMENVFGLGANSTNDQNELSFDFSLGAAFTGIEIDIVFGTDEGILSFAFQDPFAVLVNGTNIAESGGTPLYQQATSASFFAETGTNIQGTNYDALTSVFTLSINLAPGTHTMTLAIADILDTSVDSGLFVSNLRGIGGAAVPLPAPVFLLLGGLGALALFRRRAEA